ncbi:hypothetical protein ASPCAL07576 [Aspergillus calidoustus]|uniref:Uncharacterized protein n=1 Tax=Aspergillus calidoustus TaxID=454130 RepID=A0A0U4ZY32_ASPCI|nr:hypothetical protein ASPCAL07576 [Aspergillus calidoustus]
MSLHRILLYLLSLTSAALGTDQDTVNNPTHTSDIDTSSSYSRNLFTKTFSYGGSIPPPSSLPGPHTHPPSLPHNPRQRTVLTMQVDTETVFAEEPHLEDTRCSASHNCLPGDYCFVHDASIRCCPEGLACFSITADVCYEQTVYWYEEVHVHYVDVDEDGGEGEEVAVVTEWEVESSVVQTATRVTVTASYPADGRGEFARVSRGIVRDAETRVVLDEVPTRTREITRGVRRTSGVEDIGMLDGLGLWDEQVVLG